MALLALLLWDPLAAVMRLEDPLPPVVVAAAMPFGGLQAYGNQLLQAKLRMKLAGLIFLAQPLTIVTLALASFVLTWIRPGPIAIAADVVAGIAAAGLLLVTGHRPTIAMPELARILRDAREFAPGAYGQVFLQRADRFVVSIVLGQAALGAYSAADALATAAMRVINTLRWFLVPIYGRLASEGSDRLARLRSLHVRLWSAYAIVLMAAIVASANGLVGTLYGSGSGAVRDPLRILSLGLEPAAMTVALFTATTGVGHFRNVLVVTWLTASVQLVLLAVLSASFGVVGSAAARLLALTISATGYAALAVRLGADRRPLELALVAWIAAAVIASLLSLIPVVWPARAVLGGLAATAVVWVLLIGAEERKILRGMARPR